MVSGQEASRWYRWVKEITAKDIALGVLGVVFGVIVGQVAEPFWNDLVAPRIFRTDAVLTVKNPRTTGNEILVDVKTKWISPDHSLYIVEKLGDRYWPQAALTPHSSVLVTLTVCRENNAARTSSNSASIFHFQVIDVTGAADDQVRNYFDRLSEGKSSAGTTSIGFRGVQAQVNVLKTVSVEAFCETAKTR